MHDPVTSRLPPNALIEAYWGSPPTSFNHRTSGAAITSEAPGCTTMSAVRVHSPSPLCCSAPPDDRASAGSVTPCPAVRSMALVARLNRAVTPPAAGADGGVAPCSALPVHGLAGAIVSFGAASCLARGSGTGVEHAPASRAATASSTPKALARRARVVVLLIFMAILRSPLDRPGVTGLPPSHSRDRCRW